MAHLVTKVAEYGIIIHKNKFLLLQLSKDADPKQAWILPGGRLEENEKPMHGLIREIKEETNLYVEVINPCHVGSWGEGEDKRYAVFYICKPKSHEVRLSKEHDNFKWLTPEELLELTNQKPHLKEAIKKAFNQHQSE